MNGAKPIEPEQLRCQNEAFSNYLPTMAPIVAVKIASVPQNNTRIVGLSSAPPVRAPIMTSKARKQRFHRHNGNQPVRWRDKYERVAPPLLPKMSQPTPEPSDSFDKVSLFMNSTPALRRYVP